MIVYEPTAVHCAYSVTLALNVYAAPAAYDEPVPLASVFQPANVYPVRASDPEFDRNVTEPEPVVADGTEPDVLEFPL